MIAMSSGCWLMASRTCVRAQSRCRESKCVSQTSCAFVWLGLAGRRLSAEAIQRGAHRAFAMTHFQAHAILLVDEQRVVDDAGLVRRFAHAQHQSQRWRQRPGDRKSVVEGTGGAVLRDTGGSRCIKKTKK